MNRLRIFPLLLLMVASNLASPAVKASPTDGGPGQRKSASPDPKAYHRFIPNANQWDPQVRYMTDLVDGRLWLRHTGFSYVFHDVERLNAIHDFYYHEGAVVPEGRRIDDETLTAHAFHVEFVGADPGSTHRAELPSSHAINFFLGNDPAHWATGLHAHERVHYDEIYPGIGMDMYSVDRNLKYDFRVAPGSDPDLIRMAYQGVDGLSIIDGELNVRTSVTTLREMRPFAYQILNGEMREVACEFQLQGNVVSFRFPHGYDPALPLVIDPTLVGATYSGSTAMCFGHTATYDDLGRIYAGGICFGTGFPATTGAFQIAFGGNVDHGINKYSPTATTLIWSTYIGGGDGDYPHSMIVNSQDQLVVLGSTSSGNFPTLPGSFQTVPGGGFSDITVTVLNSAATSLVGSTYVGGTSQDGNMPGTLNMNYGDNYRGEVIVDGSDNIYVASSTVSSDFPVTPGAFQTAMSGPSDAVAFKLNPSAATMVWATFLGGVDDESGNSIKVKAGGDVYLAGGTNSASGFPTTAGALNTSPLGDNDGYLVHLNSTGSAVLQGTLLGTAGRDQAYFVEIDAQGFPYVLGQAAGYVVTAGAYSQPGGELFMDKLSANLSSSIASTTLGDATSGLSPTAFLVDICGNVYAAAWGNTATLPVTPNAFQPIGGDDFYLITLLPNMSGLLYATSFGGNGWEHVDGGTSRFDKRGVVYEASCSSSQNWPVTPGAVFSTSTGNGWDVVCFKFEFNFINITSSFATAQAPGGCAPFTVNFVNQSSISSSTFYHWDFGNGDTDTAYNPVYAFQNPGTYTVTLVVYDTSSCAGSDTSTIQVVIVAAPPISLNQDTTTCGADSVQLHAVSLPGATYLWSPAIGLSSTSIPNPMASPPGGSMAYNLTVTDTAGCVSTGVINVNLASILIDAGPLAASCEGAGGAQLQAGPISGGVAPYYYTWWCDSLTTNFCGLDSINDNDPIANPTSSTWYYLQVTDFNGCLSEIDSVMVEVRPKPIVDAGPDVGICAQPAPGALISATVLNAAQAPGPYTVQWIPATGLNDPTIFSPYARPDTTTIYAAIVSSSNGCTSEFTTVDTTSSITVTVHPRPIADAGPDRDICLGDSLMVQGLGYGAGPVYDFQWSPSTGLSDSAITNPLASPPFTHTYSLTVWSNGCPSYGDTMLLDVHTLPTPSAGNIVELCLGETGQLDAFGAGDSTAFYTYHWFPATGLSDPSAENPLVNPDSSTVYFLEVMSNFGCRSPLDSVLVRLKPTPIAEAGPTIQICEGQSVTLPGGYSYATTDSAPAVSQIYFQWNPAASLSDPNIAQPLATPTQSAWYTLAVTHNTCLTVDSVLVVLNPTPSPVVGADTLVACEGVPVQLHAGGGLGAATFSWSPATGLDDPSSANPTATPTSTTTYLLTMEEAGCFTTVPLTLSIIPAPQVAALSSSPSGCVPLHVSFLETSHTAQSYTWDFGDGGPVGNGQAPVHIYSRPGTYTVQLSGYNTGACRGLAEPMTITVLDTIHADFSIAAAGQPATDYLPLVLHLPEAAIDLRNLSTGAATGWSWDFGDGELSDAVHPTHAYMQPGTYMVTLRSLNPEGCMSTLRQGPVIVLAPDLFIPNAFTPNGDGIGDAFLVEYSGSQALDLTVLDRWGMPLYQTRNKLAGWDGRNRQGAAVPEGVYYYLVRVGESEFAGNLTLMR